MGPCTDRPSGSGDVLVVRVIVLVDVGSGSQEGLNEVHADRSPGPGAVHELAAGLFRDEPADVREDDDHQVSVRPHSERGRQGLDEALHVRHHELLVGNEERKDARNPVADHSGQGRDEVDLVGCKVVGVRRVRDVNRKHGHERGDDGLDRRAGTAAADVSRNHRSGWLDPPKEEGKDQDHTRRRPERERRPVPVKPTRLIVDFDPVDTGLVGSAAGRSCAPSARWLFISVFGTAGPEEPTKKSHTHPSEVGQTSV